MTVAEPLPLAERDAVLLLGGSADQCPLIEAARARGLATVVVDRDPEAPGLAIADHPAIVSTRDVPGLVAHCRHLLARGIRLRGVSVMGSDVPHVVAAVAEAFGWVGPDPETAALATHKRRMRECFAASGVAVPRFGVARTPDDVRRFRSAARCEAVVLKPVDSAGSRGVRVVHGDAGIEAALADARAAATSDEVQVEEFVPGLQISTETLLTEAHAETPGFADRNYADTVSCHPIVLENGGWMPSALAPAQRAAVEALVVRAARSLGIVRGVAKGDVVVHETRGPMLIEMAARLGGGDFASSLVPLSTGVDYLGAALAIALGDEPDWAALRPSQQRVVANRYLFAPPGRLDEVRGLDLVRSWPETRKLELFVHPGEVLAPITHHGSRSGVFVLAGASRAQIVSRIAEAYAAIEFRVDGIWRHAAPPDLDPLSR